MMVRCSAGFNMAIKGLRTALNKVLSDNLNSFLSIVLKYPGKNQGRRTALFKIYCSLALLSDLMNPLHAGLHGLELLSH